LFKFDFQYILNIENKILAMLKLINESYELISHFDTGNQLRQANYFTLMENYLAGAEAGLRSLA